MRERGQKLTKIYQKSGYPFLVAYGVNFHFPKKLNFFIDRKIFYEPYRRGYFFGILGFVWKKGGKIKWWVKRATYYSLVSVSKVFLPWYFMWGDIREWFCFNVRRNFPIFAFLQEKIGNFFRKISIFDHFLTNFRPKNQQKMISISPKRLLSPTQSWLYLDCLSSGLFLRFFNLLEVN